MTRAFDTGLVDALGRPVAVRTYVRNRVIDLLTRRFDAETGEAAADGLGILRAHGGWLAAIVKLGGPLPAYNSDEGVQQLWSQLLGQAPAIGLAVGDREVQKSGTSGFRSTSQLDVHLYFVSNHPRSVMARVEADVRATGNGAELAADPTADPGVDVAMELAEELLVGQQSGAGKQMQLRRETIGVVNNTHVIAEQRYLVTVERAIDHTRGLIKKLVGFNTLIHPPGDAASPASVAFTTELEEAP
jgi:hypothetical protein